jgi:hypothetical protein
VSLTDTTSLLTACKVVNTAQNYARYDLLRRQVEAAVKVWCKWEIEQATVTEFYDGTGYTDIVLRRPYVSAVLNVWQDPTGYYGDGTNAFSGAPLVLGSDYGLVRDDGTRGKSGLLRRLSNPQLLFPSDVYFNRGPGGLAYQRPADWQVGSGNVKVQYTFGFPSALVVTAMLWSGGVATYTTATAHGLQVGQVVNVVNATPAGYGGTLFVSGATSLTFTASVAVNPGIGVSATLDAVPQDVKLAVEAGVSIAATSARFGGPASSEGIGAHNYSLPLAREPEFASVRQLLSRYRDLSVG